LALVVVVRTWLVPVLVIVTVTFGTTAPLGSTTVPVRDPVVAVWAKSEGTKTNKETILKQKYNKRLMLTPHPHLKFGFCQQHLQKIMNICSRE
jgi:hypothetical protein